MLQSSESRRQVLCSVWESQLTWYVSPLRQEAPDAVRVHGRQHVIISRALYFHLVINFWASHWVKIDQSWPERMREWECPMPDSSQSGSCSLKHACAQHEDSRWFQYNQGTPGCCWQGTTVAIIKGRQQMMRAIYSNTLYGLAALHKRYMSSLSQDEVILEQAALDSQWHHVVSTGNYS